MPRPPLRPLAVLVASLAAVAGCDVLEPDPPGLTSAEFYRTEAQIEQAVVGVYGPARELHNTLQWAFGEMRSDNTSFQYNPDDRGGSDFEAIDEFVLQADNGAIQSYWDVAYRGIARANFVLASVEENGVAFSSAEAEGRLLGAARFFRAWYHFQLVRLYGDVPLLLEPATSLDDFTAVTERTPVDRVYNEGIVPDLQAAVDLLSRAPSQGQNGRITEGAARTLLADVYMTRQDWGAAVEQLQAVRQLGYSLEADFADNFDPSNKNGPESIWEVQYDASDDNLGQSSNFTTRFVPFNSRRDIIGAGVPGFASPPSTSGRNQPTDDLLAVFDRDADARFPVSIGVYADRRSATVFDCRGDDGTCEEPYVNKYNYGLDQNARENVNWPVYRYGGALLMLAESLVEAGRPGEAQSFLDEVRARAGLGPIPATRENVREERRRELAFENHRWFDLLRWGVAVETMQTHGQQQIAEKGVQPTGTLIAGAYQTIRTLLAIPQQEVNQFGYRQNPGW